MQIVIDGLLVHYEIRGSGDTILFIHGWADRLETFSQLSSLLSDSYKLVLLDLPGFGQSEAPKNVWKLDDYATFIAAFLSKIGSSTELFAIIGHSNGGAVAIRGVSMGVLKPQKMVLLAASGVRDSARTRRLILKAIAKTGKIATFWLPAKHKKILQKKLYGAVGSDMLVSPELKETFKQTVRQDIQADAASITLPTLLIYGDDDTATPIRSVGSKLHQLINGSQFEVISNADHFVHQREPAKVARLISEFL